MDINEVKIGQCVAFVGIVRAIKDGVVCVVDQSCPDSRIYRLFSPRFLSPWTSCPRETSRGYKARIYAEDWRPQGVYSETSYNMWFPGAISPKLEKITVSPRMEPLIESHYEELRKKSGGGRDRIDAANINYLTYMSGFEGCFPENEAGSVFGEILKNRNAPSSSTQTTGNKEEALSPPAPSLTQAIKDYREKFKAIMGGWDWAALQGIIHKLDEEALELHALCDDIINDVQANPKQIAAELADIIIVAMDYIRRQAQTQEDAMSLEQIIQGRIDSNLDRAERAREAAVLKDTKPEEEWETTKRLFEL